MCTSLENKHKEFLHLYGREGREEIEVGGGREGRKGGKGVRRGQGKEIILSETHKLTCCLTRGEYKYV